MYLPTATSPYPTYLLPLCVLTTIAYHVLLTTAYCLLPTAYCLLPTATYYYYLLHATGDVGQRDARRSRGERGRDLGLRDDDRNQLLAHVHPVRTENASCS